VTPEQTLLRKVRRLVWTGRVNQACTCLAGAYCLWCAIDDWLTGHASRSAIWTVLAFVNGANFVTLRTLSAYWRTIQQKLRLIVRQR
jgi:hypothetical protein